MADLIGTGVSWFARTKLAQTDGTLRLQELHAPIEVIRDRWGVSHIYASNVPDALFAQGFVHAEDRLWQMEFNRRLVAGRLAEVLGATPLPVDRWMRILGMRRVAEAEVALLRLTSAPRLTPMSPGSMPSLRAANCRSSSLCSVIDLNRGASPIPSPGQK